MVLMVWRSFGVLFSGLTRTDMKRNSADLGEKRYLRLLRYTLNQYLLTCN